MKTRQPTPQILIGATVAAVLLALFGYMFGRSTATVNETLATVVADLSRSSAGSTVVAAALLAGSAILASVLVPLVVVITAIHVEKKEKDNDPIPTNHSSQQPAASSKTAGFR